MPKLTLDITPEQHDQLKSIADSHQLSVQEYILETTLHTSSTDSRDDEAEAIRKLGEFLRPRLEEAIRGEFSHKMIQQIKQEARESIK